MREGQLLRFLAYLVFSIAVMLLAACGSSQKEEAMDRSRPPASPAPAEPAPGEAGRPVIVALGDSLTAGLGVNLEENYPSKLQKKLDRAGYRYRVVNAGVSGDTTAQ